MRLVRACLPLVAVSVLMSGVNSQAIPVSGVIAFEGSATVSSTAVTSWSNTRVASVTGFGGIVGVGESVTLATPWSFNSGAVNNLWSVHGFEFDLTSSSVIFQAFGAVLVTGVGTISGNGYDATYGTWSFYSRVPQRAGSITTPIFSFSVAEGRAGTGVSTTVPDGGTTLILLGVALSVVAVLKRILRKEMA